MNLKQTILIVDDSELNRIVLKEILANEYNIFEAESGNDAIQLLFHTGVKPDAILLDIMMPEMDGFEVLKIIKSNHLTESIPVLFITAADAETNETKSLLEGAVDYISKPFIPDAVRTRLHNHIQLNQYHSNLEMMMEEKISELNEIHEKILETLATIIEYRSLESGEHIKRTTELTKALIQHLLTKEKFTEILKKENYPTIIKASALHDIGKIGISDRILLKPGALTKEEFEEIKKHAIIGYNIIESLDVMNMDTLYLKHCRDICRSHHERWDGKGYPDNLSQTEIPLSARILSVVDVYDAITSKRCYKPAYSHEETMDIIYQGRGTQFDPDILDATMEISNTFKKLSFELRDKP